MKHKHTIWIVLLAMTPATSVLAVQDRPYRLDIGLQAGIGYYVGDATAHIFTSPLDVYGVQLRYKFDPRWSLQLKTMRQRYTFRNSLNAIYYNAMWNTDLCAEFNFFRFGIDDYDKRYKRITPYMFLGFGVAVYGKNALPSARVKYPMFISIGGAETLQPALACYIPFGFGVKWKFAQRWQMHLAWQHNFYWSDGIEGLPEYDDKHKMNGSNFLYNDLTGQLTLGIVFEIAREKKICRYCYDD